jgi:hypothetical protein
MKRKELPRQPATCLIFLNQEPGRGRMDGGEGERLLARCQNGRDAIPEGGNAVRLHAHERRHEPPQAGLNQHQQHKDFSLRSVREQSLANWYSVSVFQGVNPSALLACQHKLWLAVCTANNSVASTFQRWQGGCVD